MLYSCKHMATVGVAGLNTHTLSSPLTSTLHFKCLLAYIDAAVVPVVSRMDKSMNLIEGDRLELDCSSWGWPVPNVTWWRRDPLSGVDSDPTLNTIISYSKSVTGARLTIEQVALTDYSKYVCVAANTVGSTNATTLVRVKG